MGCDYRGLLIEGENCPECGKPSIQVGPVSYDEYMNGKLLRKEKREEKIQDKSVMEYICLNPVCVHTERLEKYQKCPDCGHTSGKIGPVKLLEIIHKKKNLSKKLEKKDIIEKVSINRTFKGIAGHIKLYKDRISINEKKFAEDPASFWGLYKTFERNTDILFEHIFSVTISNQNTDPIKIFHITNNERKEIEFVFTIEYRRLVDYFPFTKIQCEEDENPMNVKKKLSYIDEDINIGLNSSHKWDFEELKSILDEKIIENQEKIKSSETAENKTDLNELEKLAEFKDKGIITEKEFNAKKKQILGL